MRQGFWQYLYINRSEDLTLDPIISSMGISPGDQFLTILDSDGLVTRWNLETGVAAAQWQGPSNGLIVNGRLLFSKVRGLSGLIKVWDIASQREYRTLHYGSPDRQ